MWHIPAVEPPTTNLSVWCSLLIGFGRSTAPVCSEIRQQSFREQSSTWYQMEELILNQRYKSSTVLYVTVKDSSGVCLHCVWSYHSFTSSCAFFFFAVVLVGESVVNERILQSSITEDMCKSTGIPEGMFRWFYIQDVFFFPHYGWAGLSLTSFHVFFPGVD